MVAELGQKKGKENKKMKLESKENPRKRQHMGPIPLAAVGRRRRNPPSPENGTSSSPQTTTDQTRFTLIYEGEEVRNGNEEAFWRGGGRMVSDYGRENEEMVRKRGGATREDGRGSVGFC